MNVAVFCGSREGNNPQFKIIAYQLGQELARRGHSILYGGGGSGLMGAVAQGSIDMGGTVSAVFPEFLTHRELGYIAGVETEYVQTMHERKPKMYHPADAVIILPG